MDADTPGVVYLLHFDRPHHHAQHYLGWTNNLGKRLMEHMNGRRDKCVLTSVIKDEGIGFKVSRLWCGPLELEKKLKRRKNSRKLCSICNPQEEK